MSTGSTSVRIDLHVDPYKRDIIARAAALLGIAIEEFIIERALPDAERIVAEDNRTRLSREDWARFVAKLDETPKELPELRRLMQGPSVFVKS